jgi:hypothetical protein
MLGLGLGNGIVHAHSVKKLLYLAANFDGADDFITVPDDDALSFTSSTGFGISMWLKLDSGNHGVLVKAEEYKLHVKSNGETIFLVCDDSENLCRRRTTAIGSFPFAQWTHVICEYTTGKMPKIYFNGVIANGTYTFETGFDELENNSGDLLIGKASLSTTGTTSGTTVQTDGGITNLHIYSGNLTSTEKIDVYGANVDGSFSSNVNNTIIASYPLTSNLNDSSDNGHNGSSAEGQSPSFVLV